MYRRCTETWILNLRFYRVVGETEKGYVTNAVEGTKQYMGSSQWVARRQELSGGSNPWKGLVEMGSVFRSLKGEYCLSSLRGWYKFLRRGQDLCKGQRWGWTVRFRNSCKVTLTGMQATELLKVSYSQLVNALGPDTIRLFKIRSKPGRSLLLWGFKVCIYSDCGSCSDRYETCLDAAVLLMGCIGSLWSSLGMNKFQSLHISFHTSAAKKGGN